MGKNDRIINEINYKTSKFLDPDPESNPDYIIRAQSKVITKTIKQKFDNIILAASPTALVLSSIIENTIIPVDGKLNDQLFSNIRLLLNNNGSLYSTSQFYYTEDETNDQLYIDKMFKLGFIFERFFKFEIYGNNLFIKLIKTELPTKNECFDYLSKVFEARLLLDKDSHIQFIYLKYYSNVYDTEITQKTIVDDDFNIEDLLPYKNLDDYDPDYVSDDEKHTSNDIIKLKYIMFDGTSVTLI